jgi:hypothetical protein
MRLGIVKPQGKALDVAGGAVNFKLLDLRTAFPDFPRHRGAVEFNPRVGAG